MKLRLAAAFAALTTVSVAAAQDAPKAPPPSPVWLTRPTGEDLEKAYPPDALAKGVSGAVRVQCVFNDAGKLTDCKVLSEEPAGAGFGEAGLVVVAAFQAEKLAKDGRPIAGAPLIIPMRFAPPPPEGPVGEAVGLVDLDGKPPVMGVLKGYYPDRAMAGGVSGRSEIHCSVKGDRTFEKCEAVGEEPTGWGFGPSGVRLIQQLKLAPGPARSSVTATFVYTISGKDSRNYAVQIGTAIASPGTSSAASAPGIQQPGRQRRYYPQRALVAEKNGDVVLTCFANTSGELSKCSVKSEEPKGYGFGQAALQLAPQFKVKPETVPEGGMTMDIPIPFRLN